MEDSLVKTNLKKFEEIYNGWEIVFQVELDKEEAQKCNMDPVKSVGDYEIERQGNAITFSCIFDQGELWENETIDTRLGLIKKDIEHLANSCLN